MNSMFIDFCCFLYTVYLTSFAGIFSSGFLCYCLIFSTKNTRRTQCLQWLSVQVLYISPLTMGECPICSRHVLPHAKQAKCCICLYNHHMECLTLQPEVCEYIQENNSTWYCQMCITETLPFNHNENEYVFTCDINCIETCSRTIEQLSELMFNPFELNMDDHYSPLYDVDPDMNYCNELDSHIGLNCNYYFDNCFPCVIREKLKETDMTCVFSLCHINIRSLKANLPTIFKSL